jgi:hypothetical protein
MDTRIIDKNFDFSQTAVVRPPSVFNEETKSTRIVVDSRDRNRQIYPNPNNYVIDLDYDIKEVTAMHIVTQDVPLSLYNITMNNNKIKVIMNGEAFIFEVPPGNYDAFDLATTLTTLIGITVTFSPTSLKIKFTYTSPFSIDFVDKQYDWIALLLGFVPQTLYESALDVIVAPFIINLNIDRYIILNIDQVNVYEGSNNIFKKITSIIGNELSSSLLHFIKKSFSPPISRLNKLKIQFLNYYGCGYDFQNRDHRIEFIFESRKHPNKFLNQGWDS